MPCPGHAYKRVADGLTAHIRPDRRLAGAPRQVSPRAGPSGDPHRVRR